MYRLEKTEQSLYIGERRQSNPYVYVKEVRAILMYRLEKTEQSLCIG
jgi:hypothetical protein